MCYFNSGIEGIFPSRFPSWMPHGRSEGALAGSVRSDLLGESLA